MPSPIKQTVAGAFAEFEDALKLDKTDVDSARRRHNEVRDCLTATDLVATSFLQGSFARKTMISPLNDVDVVLVLPRSDEDRLRSPGGPAKSMEQLKPHLSACFPGVVFDAEKRADHALRLDFTDVDFHIDLVPAFDLHNDNGDVDIADRARDRWERSNTRELMRVVSERNSADVTDGRFVPQVRMLKTFCDEVPDLDVCGLMAESLAFDVVTTRMSDGRALLAAFQRGAGLTSGTLTDPTGVDDLLVGWSWERRQVAAAVFDKAAQAAAEALALEAEGDEAGAIDIWHRLLGPHFPAAEGLADEQAVFRAWKGVTSANRVTPAAAAAQVPARTVRSHRTP
jgi:hypothetical protein